MKSFVLAYADDWEGLYHEGKLLTQGHKIQRDEYAKLTKGEKPVHLQVIYRMDRRPW